MAKFGSPMLGSKSWVGKPPKDAVTGEVATYENILQKTGYTLLTAFVGIAVGWVVGNEILGLGAMLVSIVLSFVIGFKHIVKPGLIFLATALYGLGIGTISVIINNLYPGVVNQALLATAAVVGVTYCLFRFGKFRTTPKFRKILFICLSAYGLFMIVNIVLALLGWSGAGWGWNASVTLFGIPLGIIIGGIAVIMGAMCLIVDFETIENAVKNGQPANVGWYIAYGLVMTILWIYVEILRILSILNQR